VIRAAENKQSVTTNVHLSGPFNRVLAEELKPFKNV
jgi:hypothetical protein